MKKLIAWLVIVGIVLVVELVFYLLGGMKAVWLMSALILFAFVSCYVFYLIVSAICWAVDIITGNDQ
jgi:hypothetical protein